MMEEVLAWLQHSEGPLGYAALAAACCVEYLVPPLPGDTVALFGIVLAATAGWSAPLVYLALNVGAVGGGMAVYGIGRWIGGHRAERTPRFLRTQQAREALDATIARFERHGALYLLLNRFVPALRGFFFLAAGIAGIPAWKVALYGTISAMLWNALLLALGWAAGSNLERLQGWLSIYTWAALAVVAVVVGVMIVRAVRARRRARVDGGG